MTRTLLDAKLREISTGVIQLGTLVVTALEQALQALQSGDEAVCNLVIESDDAIDKSRSEVEHLTFQALALQQPLGGRDLRFLSSVPSITANLERIGDNAVGIAKLLLLMTPLRATGTSQVHTTHFGVANDGQKDLSSQPIAEASIISELFDLGQESCRVLRGTIDAFKQNNAPAARNLRLEDDVVDVRYHLVRKHLTTILTGTHAISALQQDSLILLRMTYWFWIAHNLERVGDHCTNICEHITFFLEGYGTTKPTRAG